MNMSGMLTTTHGRSAHYPSCPLCDGSIYSGEPCGNCRAPSEVISSIIARERKPTIMGVLGASGVGKTVYLGMLLDMLARGANGLHGLARGPFSLELHRNTMLALERQRFPVRTPNEADRWKWVHWEVTTSKKGRVYDIVTPDIAGEAILHELTTPNSNPTVRAIINRCSALVVLVDVIQLVADGQGQELFAMQLITYLDSMRPTRRRQKIKLPVALVFTKSDVCEEPIRDPEQFVKTNATSLWRLCESRLESFKFFCSGVAGATAQLVGRDGIEIPVPLRIEPRGIVEPFAWLLSTLK